MINLKALVIGAIVFVIIGGVYTYGNHKYNDGYNRANQEFQSTIISYHKANIDSNNKVMKAIRDQKEAYRVALNVRNDQYKTINNLLSEEVRKNEKLKRESTNKCVNAVIPDDFK